MRPILLPLISVTFPEGGCMLTTLSRSKRWFGFGEFMMKSFSL
jgi:hypothetical protein